MRNELLRLEDIYSTSYGQQALSAYSMSLYEGELLGVFSPHLLVKNDLVELLLGHKAWQSGRMYIEGEPCPFEEVCEQRLRKVGAVRAAQTLIDDLNIAENIFVMRRGLKSQIIDKHVLRTQTQQLMDEFELPIDPNALSRNISVVDRCRLEIVKSIALGARILILQDLSGFLADFEIDKLLNLVARLKNRGLAFLMVDSANSHLLRYSDRVIVIKNGRNFWSFGRGQANETLIDACFSNFSQSEELSAAALFQRETTKQTAALVFDKVQSEHLPSLSFALHPGEELCIVDQSGKGIEEIKTLLSGERKAVGGQIRVAGHLFDAKNIWQALDQKVAFVVENPADNMLFPDFTALENLCFPASRKTRNFWIDPVFLASCQQEYASFFDSGVLQQYPDNLSAQDLQKLVYCRWHLYNPKVVVCIKPFSSVEKSLEDTSAYCIDLLLKKNIAVLILASNAFETRGRKNEIRLTAVAHR